MGFTKDFAAQIKENDKNEPTLIPINELPLSSLLGSFEVSPVSSEEIKESENDSDETEVPKAVARKKPKMNELPPTQQDDQRRKNREAAVRYRKARRNRREALEKKIDDLSNAHELLKEEISSLQKMYNYLKSAVENHNCKLPEQRLVFQE